MPHSSKSYEALRISSLNSYHLLDSEREECYDELTALCAELCGAPFCTITLVDSDRLWFKSKFGFEAETADKTNSFCSEALNHDGIFVVENAQADPRFSSNELVTGNLGIQFYASFVLKGREGLPLGTFCILDTSPRTLKSIHAKVLATIGKQVLALMELHRTIRELEDNELIERRDSERFQMAIETSRIGLWDWNIETNEFYLDPGWEAILDYGPGELAGHVDSWRESIYDGDKIKVFQALDLHLSDPTNTYEIEYRAHRKHGGLKWILTRGRTVRFSGDGKPTRMIGTIIDITSRKQTESDLFEVQERFRSAINSMREGIMVRSRTGEVQLYNNRSIEILGITGRQLESLDPFPEGLKIYFEDETPVTAESQPSQQCLTNGIPIRDKLICIDRTEGNLQWISVNASPLFRSGETRPESVVVTFADVTESKIMRDEIENQIVHVSDTNVLIEMQRLELEEANRKLEDLASLDGLTGLKNHRHFQERLVEECKRCERYNTNLCLILLDVDKFKQYNDTYGHPAGDEVLRTVATLLAETARTNDVVARYGGEEFTILLPETDLEAALLVAERCRVAIESFEWPKREVTASFGLSNLKSGLKSTDILAHADSSLYKSKSAGRNCVTVYSPETVDVQDSQASISAQADIARA